MGSRVLAARMMKELSMLEQDPPHGISAWPKDEKTNFLEASIIGPEGTPYQGGTFKMEISIPDRYPFEPPNVRFSTPIYHPNIDNGGRICLDTLVMPPKGVWKPSLNISTVLTSIQSLMAEPNPDDGLVAEIVTSWRFSDRRREPTKEEVSTKENGKEEIGNEEVIVSSDEEEESKPKENPKKRVLEESEDEFEEYLSDNDSPVSIRKEKKQK